MRLFNFFKNNNFSQSGQDQFAYNLCGEGGTYLEIGAHDPIINSNTFNLDVKCNWKGISIEYDKTFKKSWDNCIERENNVIWDDAFNIDFSSLIKEKGFSNKFNYLSCDIEPAENTFNILEKIIDSNLVFDFISYEHDKYNIGNKFEILSMKFLKNHDYKVAIRDVYSRKKKHKVYETWFIHFDIDFEEMQYSDWRKNFYKNNKFSL